MESAVVIAAADDTWQDRCEYWASPLPRQKRTGRPARHTNEPLIVTGQGLRMQVHQGSLVIRGGFTHYPQKQAERRYFPGDRQMPSRIIIVDGKGSLTLDVMTWLSDRNISLARVDWRGNAVTMLGNSYSLNPECVKSQLRAQGNPDALRIATSLINSKLRSCLDTLATLPNSVERDRAIEKHKREILLLKRSPPRSIPRLLGIEGAAALNYFSAWQSLRLSWRILKARPIPAGWLTFESRASHKGKTGDNVGATHPINACLNYAYAILETHVRLDVIGHGYDPTIGFLHTYKRGRDALVLDLMEPLRAVVDQAIIDFVQSNEFHPSDFTIRQDGVCRLNPQMAKRVALVALNSLSGKSALSTLSFQKAAISKHRK